MGERIYRNIFGGIMRTISVDISHDTAVNKLTDFEALLYTWLIAHSQDDGIVYGDANEIFYKVMPGRPGRDAQDIREALGQIASAKQDIVDSRGNHQSVPLIRWDGKRVIFPSGPFYKHQNRISRASRRPGWDQSQFPGDIPKEQPKIENDPEFEQKFKGVLEICPSRNSPNAQNIIEAAIKMYNWIPVDQVIQCMREVLDKYNKAEHRNRSDWATLFARRLEWRSKDFSEDENLEVHTFDELRSQREEDQLLSQKLAAQRLKELREEEL
jgi:hypothetical protein